MKRVKIIIYNIILYYKIKIRNRNKIFVIGFNKTGTTTLEKALKEFGYILGNQMKAYRLMDDIFDRKYKKLYKYCKTGEAFQDIPFSRPEIYKLLDKEFPNSKFILSVRDTKEQWFNSIVKFHSKLFGNGDIPSKKNLLDEEIIYKGWRYKVHTELYGELLYDEEVYTNIYEKHILDVEDYFKNRKDDLLIINVSKDSDYYKLCSFLKVSPLREGFPWENKTNKIEAKK